MNPQKRVGAILKSHLCLKAAFFPFLEQAAPSAFHLEPSETSPLHNRDCSDGKRCEGGAELTETATIFSVCGVLVFFWGGRGGEKGTDVYTRI